MGLLGPACMAIDSKLPNYMVLLWSGDWEKQFPEGQEDMEGDKAL